MKSGVVKPGFLPRQTLLTKTYIGFSTNCGWKEETSIPLTYKYSSLSWLGASIQCVGVKVVFIYHLLDLSINVGFIGTCV